MSVLPFFRNVCEWSGADMLFKGFNKIGAAIKSAFEAGFGHVSAVIEQTFGVAYFSELDIFFYTYIGMAFEH